MITEKVKELLNEQINKEFYSGYLYLAMSAYFDKTGLHGFANWTKVKAKNEIDHGMSLFEYLLDRNSNIHLKSIAIPSKDFNSPIQVFEEIYEHEKNITSSINEIAYLSLEECDLATKNFINWYINEQVEEEKTALDIVTKLKLFGDEKISLYMLDKELSEYKYTSEQH